MHLEFDESAIGTLSTGEEYSPEILAVHKECNKALLDLVESGDIVPVRTSNQEELTEEYIEGRICKYVQEHKKELLSFLGEHGKILVPLYSAKKFADIIIKELGIDSSTAAEIKIQTYSDGESTGKGLEDSTKEELRAMIPKEKANVLIIEDLFDTGHTVDITNQFLEEEGVGEVRTLCLFDKNIKKDGPEKVRKRLGKRFSSIIDDIGDEFVLGFGMDFENRLCSNMKGLWKVVEESSDKVVGILKGYSEEIKLLPQS